MHIEPFFDKIINNLKSNLIFFFFSVNWDGGIFDCVSTLVQKNKFLFSWTLIIHYTFQLDFQDFNQQLDIPLKGVKDITLYTIIWSSKFFYYLLISISHTTTRIGGPRTVFDIEKCDDLLDIPVSTDNHCYGCTAGKGSSWLGTLTSD